MDRQSNDKVAKLDDDDALELFARSPAEELEAGALRLVAGGTGSCICPFGGGS